MVACQERLYPGIISPSRLGKYVWAWLVNEDDWARRLGLYGFQFWARRLTRPVGWRVWAKAHGTHNAPLFSAEEVVLLGWEKRIFGTCLMWGLEEKENIWDLFDVGIGGPLILGCSNVHITREFPSFLKSHLMQLFGIPLRLEVPIKGLHEEGFFCAIGYYWFVSRVVWLSVAGSRASMIAAWTRIMKRVKCDCQAWTKAKFARIERSRNCLHWEGYS